MDSLGLALALCNVSKDVCESVRNDSSHFWQLSLSLHSECLSRSRLSIGKYGAYMYMYMYVKKTGLQLSLLHITKKF